MRNVMRTLVGVVAFVALAIPALSTTSSATAKPTHPSYVLKSKACTTGYLKISVSSKVKGKTIKTTECEWNPSKALAKKYKAGQFCAAVVVNASTTTSSGTTIKCETKTSVVKGKKVTTTKWVQTKAAPVAVSTPVTVGAPVVTTTTVAPTPVAPATQPTTPTPTTVAASVTPTITPVRASIDPDYTQSPSNPKDVTFTYSAANSNGGTLPDGSLAFTVFVHGSVASAGGCTINVGSDINVTGGTCELVVPSFGSYDLNTSYSGGANVSATVATETVDIEPPAPTPETIMAVWGSNALTAPTAATDQVVGSQATVTVTSPNWEGATSTGITDSNGNTCTASITEHVATCTMSVTSAPTSLTVNYPGGTPVVTTQTISPYGVNQSQQVTTDWPAENVTVSGSTLTVSDQTATVNWSNWSITGQGSGQNTPPNPINIATSARVNLFVTTTGNVIPDNALCNAGLETTPTNEQAPCGYIVFTVTQTAGTPTMWTATDEELINSPSCDQSQNYVGQGEGGCSFIFGGSGTFQISAEFVSQDSNYSDSVVPTVETVNVS